MRVGRISVLRSSRRAAFVASVCFALAVGGFTAAPPSNAEDPTTAPAPTADYQFPSSRAATVGAGPAFNDLIGCPDSPCSTQNGPNSFRSDTVDGLPRTTLAFPDGNGLSLNPLTGLSDPDNYSVVILFRLDQGGSWRRIVDFLNGTSDTGLYLNPSNQLSFYDIGAGRARVAPGAWTQVAITRNARSKLVAAYVNGSPQFRFTDTSDQAVFSSDSLRLFQDNTSGCTCGENSSGAIARLRVFTTALSASAVGSLDRTPGSAPTGNLVQDGPTIGIAAPAGATAQASFDASAGDDLAIHYTPSFQGSGTGSVSLISSDGAVISSQRIGASGSSRVWRIGQMHETGRFSIVFDLGTRAATYTVSLRTSCPAGEAKSLLLTDDGVFFSVVDATTTENDDPDSPITGHFSATKSVTLSLTYTNTVGVTATDVIAAVKADISVSVVASYTSSTTKGVDYSVPPSSMRTVQYGVFQQRFTGQARSCKNGYHQIATISGWGPVKDGFKVLKPVPLS